MSELTRYSLYAPYGPQADEAGVWVKAEEAEARIAELEAEARFLRGVWWECSELYERAEAVVKNPYYQIALDDLAESVKEMPDPAKGRSRLQARLQKADELAEAVEKQVAPKSFAGRALTAYREAGR